MQLEVRGDNWTDENILCYLDWLNYVIDTDIKEFFDNNITYFLDDLYLLGNYERFGRRYRSYRPYMLSLMSVHPTCTAGRMLCVRCGDLSIAPCHRTSYEKFLFGQYIVENNEIVGAKAKNISLMNAWYRTGNSNKPKCDTCALNKMCIKGCMGAQLENTGELFYPDEKTCNFFFAKYTFLINKYEKLGLFNYEPFLQEKQDLISVINAFKQTKEYQIWTKFIQQIF